MFYLANISIQVLIKHFDLYDKSLSAIWHRMKKGIETEEAVSSLQVTMHLSQSHVFIYSFGTQTVCDLKKKRRNKANVTVSRLKKHFKLLYY